MRCTDTSAAEVVSVASIDYCSIASLERPWWKRHMFAWLAVRPREVAYCVFRVVIGDTIDCVWCGPPLRCLSLFLLVPIIHQLFRRFRIGGGQLGSV
jgi:hypothetical protein